MSIRVAAAVPVSLGAILVLTSPAAALRGERYDLASRILISHSVILAERGPKRPLGNWAAATRYKVKKVYRGSLLPGQEIEVFDDLLADPTKGLPVDSIGEERRAAWRLETDPAFRIAVLRATGGGFSRVLSEEERRPDLLFTGGVCRGRAHYVIESVSQARLSLAGLVVAAQDAKAERRSRAVDSPSWWSSMELEGGYFPVAFEPPLNPGRYRMWIEARVRVAGEEPGAETLIQTAPREVEIGRRQ